MIKARPPLRDEKIAIKANRLTRHYGEKLAVHNLDLHIERGAICGFIGPNGAGKTTTLRMLATLLHPTRGSATIFGYDVVEEADKIRPLIGYMPDQFGLYRDMIVGEYLDFFGAAYGLPGDERKAAVTDVLALTDLTEKREEPVVSLSRGMQQRLSLARVLLHDPDLLLLDEPASGLDPRARIEIRALLSELRNMNKTVFISSHILADLAEICDQVVIIEQGRNVYCGSVRELQQRTAGQPLVRISVKENPQEAARLLREHPQVSEVAVNDGRIEVALAPEAQDTAFLADLLVHAKFQILSLIPAETKLEDAFMVITQGKVS
jgi:ABC-2 type transport system ATP-binding protein